MVQKYYTILGIVAIITMIVISGCVQQPILLSPEQQVQTGVIKTCKYTLGEDTCGKCYCLETENGCEIIDISDVGDLAHAVNKTVNYDGTRDQNIIQSTRMCPHTIKFFKTTIIS